MSEEEPTEEEIAMEEASAAFDAAMPPPGPFFAARVTDNHICPMVTGVVPHVGGPILPVGCPTVHIGGMPAARVGDMLTCAGGPDVILMGSPTVYIGGSMAARMLDPTSHGGVIVTGFPTVIIGSVPGAGAGAPPPPVPSGSGQDKSADTESCFECRQRLADEGKKSSDPAVQQAAKDMDRLNHDFEHAKLSEHVYADINSPPPEGWKALDPNNPADRKKIQDMGIDPSDLDPKDGSEFRARVYEPDPAVFGDNMKPTVAFKGTTMTSAQDWKNNLQQGVGMDSDYYRNAVKIGNTAKVNGADVEFTGHSLGGGLASAASQASGNDATTFNSAGLKGSTVSKYGGTPQDSDVNAYRVENEVLTGIQEQGWKGTAAAALAGLKLGGLWGALAGAVGKVGVSAVAADAIGNKYDVKGKGNPVTRHGMDVAKKGVDEQIKAKEEYLEDKLDIQCDC